MSRGERIVSTTFVAVGVAVAGWAAAVGLTEAHLAADERLHAQCSALAAEAMRTIETTREVLAPAPPDSSRD
ncbi:MAG TPA: hypothetical protein VF158_10810 [Longimicrobiales bacterium]